MACPCPKKRRSRRPKKRACRKRPRPRRRACKSRPKRKKNPCKPKKKFCGMTPSQTVVAGAKAGIEWISSASLSI
uniref:Uncharacterized protein n=1 Tax=Megaselia scalaris TaxID=36166 RepID=T1GB22_MEGSC